MWAAALPLALAGAIAACTPATLRATGVVIDVQGPSVAEVDQFTLRTHEGAVLVFQVETLALDSGGGLAPHLRDHLVSGQPIVVEYLPGPEPLAIRYSDAP